MEIYFFQEGDKIYLQFWTFQTSSHDNKQDIPPDYFILDPLWNACKIVRPLFWFATYMLTRRGKEKSSSSLRTGGKVSLTLAREPGLEGSGRESSFRRGMEDMASWWWMCLLVSSVTRHLLSGREKM